MASSRWGRNVRTAQSKTQPRSGSLQPKYITAVRSEPLADFDEATYENFSFNTLQRL